MAGNSMKVLIACEESQEVCKAFRAKGHAAYSCDILPCSGGHPEWHFEYDLKQSYEIPQMFEHWDLIIAHPPCTYLTNSGVRWMYVQGTRIKIEKRWNLMREAAVFFNHLKNLPVKKIAVENPIPHKHAKELIGQYDQLIQPWQFGHGETKATCLWLKNLPELKPTNIVPGRLQNIWRMGPSKDRAKLRSKTFPGIAKAMAEQWG